MGRIRTIKPEWAQDEDLSKLPADTHLFSGGLLCESDDEGYFNANPILLKAHVIPLRECSVSVHDMLTQLSEIGFIQLGTADGGKRVGRVVKFAEHQRVNRPTPSKLKKLRIEWDNSVITHGELIEVSLSEGKGKEGNGNGKELRPVKTTFNGAKVQFTPIPDDPEMKVRAIAYAHPKCRHLAENSKPLPYDLQTAIVGAIEQDGEDLVLAGTLNLRDAVAKWPEGERMMAPNAVRFYKDFEYLKDPVEWSRAKAEKGSIGDGY